MDNRCQNIAIKDWWIYWNQQEFPVARDSVDIVRGHSSFVSQLGFRILSKEYYVIAGRNVL